MIIDVASLLLVIAFAHKSKSFWRINVGYVLFMVALLVVPLMDVFYVKGQVGVYGGYYVTVGAVGLCGVADSLVQGGIVGNAGELPKRYMQAMVAGTAGSGVFVSVLRLLTKAVYPQDGPGLRQSATIYFIVSIAVMLLNIIFFNISHNLPVIKYYKDLKTETVKEETTDRSSLREVVGTVKWYGFSVLILYVVTFSIVPGSVTEDVQSDYLKDWYPIILITAYNVFDLVGKSLTSVYVIENSNTAIGSSFARVLFLPVFYFCLKGPYVFRTEIPVTVLTCLIGLSNGYLVSVLMIKGPKSVELKDVETAGFVLVLYLVVGLAIGSVVSWFWLL